VELRRLLTAAAAGGYRVLASDGTQAGWLDHLRYERHADHPDEIVVRSRRLLARRRRVLPFGAVAKVRRRERTVVRGVSGPYGEVVDWAVGRLEAPRALSLSPLRGSWGSPLASSVSAGMSLVPVPARCRGSRKLRQLGGALTMLWIELRM
jgi:hypothetical protein